MTRILVVEDDPAIRRLVVFTLQQEGFEVSVAEDGLSAIASFERDTPDLVVLDLCLPDIHGFEVCKRIREYAPRPVLMLTAMSQENDIVQGFQVGADDYLTKPFSVKVLVARVEALVRRTGGRVPLGRRVEVGDLVIDLDRIEVRVGGRQIDLTPTEFRLISHLAQNAGQVVKSSQLLHEIQAIGTDEREAQDIVKVHIRHLRSKLQPRPEDPQYIRTVRGFGYLLDRPTHETLMSR
jgi:DNA-binding response OmpR family regulator